MNQIVNNNIQTRAYLLMRPLSLQQLCTILLLLASCFLPLASHNLLLNSAQVMAVAMATFRLSAVALSAG